MTVRSKPVSAPKKAAKTEVVATECLFGLCEMKTVLLVTAAVGLLSASFQVCSALGILHILYHGTFPLAVTAGALLSLHFAATALQVWAASSENHKMLLPVFVCKALQLILSVIALVALLIFTYHIHSPFSTKSLCRNALKSVESVESEEDVDAYWNVCRTVKWSPWMFDGFWALLLCVDIATFQIVVKAYRLYKKLKPKIYTLEAGTKKNGQYSIAKRSSGLRMMDNDY